jgi:hypothetical protein
MQKGPLSAFELIVLNFFETARGALEFEGDSGKYNSKWPMRKPMKTNA